MPTNPVALPQRQASPFTLRGLIARVRGSDLQVLPSHVQRALEHQRQGNEILAGWVQMTLVLLFAVFYSLSRKTFPPDTMLHPVPWALGVYGAFTVLRLVLAYRNRLGHAMLMTSVVVDISVLMVTIWSFHIQYGQVAAFYLKAPTLLYVFIFIALRALSLSPVYVLFAGTCAAVGWLILVALAIRAPGGAELITQRLCRVHDLVAHPHRRRDGQDHRHRRGDPAAGHCRAPGPVAAAPLGGRPGGRDPAVALFCAGCGGIHRHRQRDPAAGPGPADRGSGHVHRPARFQPDVGHAGAGRSDGAAGGVPAAWWYPSCSATAAVSSPTWAMA
jgi:hypothetical protein